jgi:hypothetical protein
MLLQLVALLIADTLLLDAAFTTHTEGTLLIELLPHCHDDDDGDATHTVAAAAATAIAMDEGMTEYNLLGLPID